MKIDLPNLSHKISQLNKLHLHHINYLQSQNVFLLLFIVRIYPTLFRGYSASMLKDYSWQCQIDHIWYQRWNSEQSHASPEPHPLYYPFGPIISHVVILFSLKELLILHTASEFIVMTFMLHSKQARFVLIQKVFISKVFSQAPPRQCSYFTLLQVPIFNQR